MNKQTQETIENLIKIICSERGFNFDIEVHYSEDINQDILQYVFREETISQYKQNDFSKYNGVAVPFENNGYHIIINMKLFNDLTTIIHETTHIIDYYEFRNIYNNENIDIENHPYYWGFSFYTEFNARFTAHRFYLNYLWDESYPKDIEIEELTQMINKLYSLKRDLLTKDDFYNLMQYLGRWYSIEDVCKKQYQLPHYSDLYNILITYLNNQDENSLYLLSSMFN